MISLKVYQTSYRAKTIILESQRDPVLLAQHSTLKVKNYLGVFMFRNNESPVETRAFVNHRQKVTSIQIRLLFFIQLHDLYLLNQLHDQLMSILH